MRSISIFIVAATLALSSVADAAMSKKQASQYPGKDELPDVNSPMVKKWVSEVDWSKVPKIPIAKANIPDCPDCPAKNKIHKDACWWTCGGCVAKDDVEVCPGEKVWGLTYDDGPSEDTPRLLNKLKAAKVSSTFFVVGSRVLEYPEILVREAKEGHHIALHTWSHAGMTSLTNEQIVAEIRWAEKIVFDVTGLRTKYWRPPYGDVDNRVREIARQLGYVTVIWTKEWDSNDWQLPDKEITSKKVFRNFKWALSTVPKMKGGMITLEHDLYGQTVDVAVPLLDMGMKQGLKPMDIAQCMSDIEPYQNSKELAAKKIGAAAAKTPAPAGKPATPAPAPAPPAKKPKEQEGEAQTPLEVIPSIANSPPSDDEIAKTPRPQDKEEKVETGVKKASAGRVQVASTMAGLVVAAALYLM